MRDEHGLTIKQRIFADEVLAGQPPAQAVLEAGYNPPTDNARYVQAYRLTNHPNVRQYVLDALERSGCTPDHVAGKFFKLLDVDDDEDKVGAARVRLETIKEYHKVLGAHAPTESHQLRLQASYTGQNRSELAFIRKFGRKPRADELAGKQDE